jgi:hypothetical protein
MHKQKMPILGLKPKYLSPKSTGIVPLRGWLQATTDKDLRCMQYQILAAGLASHTPWKINEG